METPRKHSPRAPAFSLKDALERALQIYEKEARHPVPTDVAAQDLGYKDGRSGPSRTALATLSQFGLLVKPTQGQIVIAPQVERYKFAPDERDKQAMLLGFIKNPSVYRSLFAKFTDSLPSDAALRYEFINMGFNQSDVEEDVKIFKQSVEFSGYYNNKALPYTESRLAGSVVTPDMSGNPDGVNPEGNIDYREQGNISASPYDRIPIRLTGGRKAWLEVPSLFYAADKTLIKSQLELIVTDDENHTKTTDATA